MSRRQVSIFINGRSVENTLKGIRSEKTKINNELQNMTIGTEEYQKKAAELRKINKIMGDHYEGIKGTESAWQKITKGAGKFIAIAGVAFTAETIISYGTELFKLGSEMEVLGKKAQTVFAEALPAVTRAAEENATAMGLTTSAYIDAATSIGDLLIPMGFARQEAAEISTNLVDLSGALAEWTGGQVEAEEVTRILGKAMLGEREELKQLGIAINEADVQARLAEKGLKDLTGEMLQQAKAAATLELITEKSADAQAAYANNTGTLVRTQAELRAQLESIRETLATALVPAFARLLNVAAGFVDVISDYTALSLADQLSEERDELNLLVTQITDTNIAQEDRNKLIGQLQTQYPDFLGNLDAETVTNEQLGKRLQEVNDQYIYRIALQREDEKIQKAAETVAQRQAAVAEKELEVRQKIIQYNEDWKLGLDLTNKSLEEQVQLTREALIANDAAGEGYRAAAGLAASGQALLEKRLDNSKTELENFQKFREELRKTLEQQLGISAPEENEEQSSGKTTISPTPDEIAAQKERAQKLAEERARQAEQELKQRERLLQRLADTTQKFQEEARLAMMEEDEAQLERIRLQFEKQIAIAAELERQGMEEATALRIELERLQQEALQMARFEQNEALIEEEMAAISDQIDAELELEEEKTERILAEIDRRNDAERKKERERQAEEISAQKKQFEEIATVAGATSSIISSALQLVGDEAARNTVQGKVLALIQIGLKTAEGIANAVAAGSGIPFPGNLPAIASGIAAVTTGIAGARQALQNTPAVPQRKEGGYVGVMGQDDGILYQARYVGRRKTGMITGGPALVDTVGGPVLANERGSEYFVNHRALQNPVVMDHVRAIDNIVRMRQFQAGGFTSPPSSPSEPASTGNAIPLQELQQMTAAVQRLNGILSGGIVAVIDDDSVVDLRNRTQKLIDASGGVI